MTIPNRDKTAREWPIRLQKRRDFIGVLRLEFASSIPGEQWSVRRIERDETLQMGAEILMPGLTMTNDASHGIARRTKLVAWSTGSCQLNLTVGIARDGLHTGRTLLTKRP